MAPRIFGVRLFDIVLSVAALWMLFYYRMRQASPGVPIGDTQTRTLMLAALCVFPLAIVGHALVNKPTALNYRLGLSMNPALINRYQ